MLKRSIQGLVTLALLGSLGWALAFAFGFGQARFFTIDEFQWGHATWLVSQGEVPYRDFYEHHLPFGYVLHSVFLQADESDAGSFVERALRLRVIAFSYLAITALMLALASFVTSRNPYESLLSAIIPLCCGYSLLSAIDYRGDNWAAFTLLPCLALVEINQRLGRRALAVLSGVLFAVSIGMTQKILVLGGGAVALMLVASLVPRRSIPLATWQLPHPLAFCGGAAVVIALAAGVGGSLGILGSAYEINVVQALEHESLYPGFDIAQYTLPFLQQTAWTSGALVFFAGAHLLRGPRRFWALPLAVALVGAFTIKAPFPYNFVLLCYLVSICAVRGFCDLVRGPGGLPGRLEPLRPALYLLPLMLLPDQIGFLDGTSDNRYQLRVLELIERHSDEQEVVIDSAGGALFRPHRGYYWYQGRAQIQMFSDYFEHDFVPDLRATQALFWIQSRRFRQLPASAKRYLLGHYIRLHGELMVLGFVTPATKPEEPAKRSFDIVREGAYYMSVDDKRGGENVRGRIAPWTDDLRIDDVPITGSTFHLQPGLHTVTIRPDSPGYRFSFLPPEAFGDQRRGPHHTPLFEYTRRRLPREAPDEG
jgi:hypothetical protein